MAVSKTRVFWLSYPDPAAKRLKFRIALGQLAAAEAGVEDAQNAICMRYKQAAGLPRGFRVWWHVLKQNIEPTTDGLDSKEQRKLSSKKQGKPKDRFPDIGEGGCGCMCFNCDIRMVHCLTRESGCKAKHP